MKTSLILAAVAAFAGTAAAQQQLPLSADLSLGRNIPAAAPGAMMPGARSTSVCDDFDRANSTNLGTDWVENLGDVEILGNLCANIGTGNAWMLHTVASATHVGAKVEFDIGLNLGTGFANTAAILGYDPITGEAVYVKVQNQTGLAGYSHVGFYHGINMGGYGGWGGFFALPYQTPGGHVTVSIDAAGDVVTMEIDEDYDGIAEITMTAPGLIASGLPALMGTEYGLGFWSAGNADNFELNDGCAPQGPTLASNGTAPAVITFDFANFGAGEQIAVVYGPAGTFTGNTPCGVVIASLIPLNPTPAQGLIFLVADGAGNAQLVQNVPAAGSGLLVQALALTSCDLTNTVTL